ncbi:MAG TPA: hypothetical protein VHP99_03345 [Pyrinomonadaceae bacterium]|nr:hypothetical protein [Pyrinomonadaceae bacterium]
MRVAIVFLLLMMLGGYVLACSVAKPVDAQKPFPLGDYEYTSYDEKGDKVVSGRVSITSTEQRRIGSEESTQLKGNWELKKVGTQETIGDQTGSGDLIGTINKNEVDINLNPNISDANVYLRGKIDGKRFHGTWTFSGYAGPVTSGKFEATRK